jgi:DNA-binding transcriptional ArsR family regulator
MVVLSGIAQRPDADQIDRLFQALADPTRRDIMRLVLATEQSVSALAARYPMSFAAVQKHVTVLERAKLVHKRRQGREQLVGGDIDAFGIVNRLLDSYAAVWRSRIDKMDELLTEGESDTVDAVPRADSQKATSKEENR